MAVRFTIFSADDPSTPSVLTFDLEKIVLGRGSVCDLRLPHPSISFHHATVEISGSRYTIRDEGSTNGTVVNGHRIPLSFRQVIKSEDVIEIGGFRIIPTLSVPMDGTHSDERVEAVARQLMCGVETDLGDARIEVVAGPDVGSSLILEREGQKSYTIGTSGEHDLSLTEPQLEDRVLRIRHSVRGWVLHQDVDGPGARKRLTHDRSIEVGETRMHFSDPVDAMYQSLLRQREEIPWNPPEPEGDPPAAQPPEGDPGEPGDSGYEEPVEEEQPREPDPPVDREIKSRTESVGSRRESGQPPEYSWMVVILGVLAFIGSLILLLLLMF